MLQAAVPNKESLHGPAVEPLSAAGSQVHRDGKALFAADATYSVQFVLLRPTDIARNVGAGVLNAGITGQDLLTSAGETGTTTELLTLAFGPSNFYSRHRVDRRQV